MGMLASLAAVLAIVVCAQISSKGKSAFRSVWFLLFGVGILVACVYFLVTSEFGDRLTALTRGFEQGDFGAVGDNSLSNRVLLYKKAFEVAFKNPLLGVGLDVFRTASLELHTIGNNSHSNYMEVLGSTGIVGVFLYYAIYYLWWSRLIGVRSLLKNSAYSGKYAIAVGGSVVMLVLDLAWVTYYEKLSLLVIAGLIAEVNLLSKGTVALAGK